MRNPRLLKRAASATRRRRPTGGLSPSDRIPFAIKSCLFVQHFRGSGWLLLILCSFQAAGFMTMSDLPDGLGRQRNSAGNSRRAHAFCRLQKQPKQVERRWPHFRSFF